MHAFIFRTLAQFLLLTAMIAPLSGSMLPTALERLLMQGEMVMLTRNSPTTYFEDRNGQTGYDYELAKSFADHLGIRLTVKTTDSLTRIFTEVEQETVTFAAAGLTVTDQRQQHIAFSTPYSQVDQHVIYRRGGLYPKQPADLAEGKLVVSSDSSHAQTLRQLQQSQLPELTWSESPELDSSDLMHMVASDNIDFTVVDSSDFEVLKDYFPSLAVAFNLAQKDSIAWAFKPDRDDSLLREANRFLQKKETKRLLAELSERFYGHLDQLTYVGARRFLKQVRKKLSHFKPHFQQAAKQQQLDWRLLAAMGYQESHWRPLAQSYTGVRGLMMITLNTAEEMGIENRLDPVQSIRGGSRYLAKLKSRIGSEVSEPDRTWMALAAYNVGLGHLRDARRLTREMGGNSNLWLDVKEALPLLSQKHYYKHTAHGYARGHEPVKYVQNIRRYYDILVWQDEKKSAFPPGEQEQMYSALMTVPPLI